MSKKEKRWRRVYLLLYILIYRMVAPLSLILFLQGKNHFRSLSFQLSLHYLS
jgi:hypothetical protein